MRLLPGQPTEIAGESITSYSLVNAAINNPDVLSRVWQVYPKDDESPISAFLASKGYFTKNVREGIWNNKFRVVNSNHVIYPIANVMARKIRIIANAEGKTFVSDAYPSEPGKNGTPFYVYLSNNWARPKEVLELADRNTHLYIYDDQTEPVEVDNGFRYEVRIVTNDKDDYVDPTLLEEGKEVGSMMSLYEQDFSETASEKYAFHGWGHSYLSLQRVKMSFSGTAEAMGHQGKMWYQFQNTKGEKKYTYIEAAEREMMKRATKFHEFQLVYGKSTVTADGQIFLKDKRGREVMAGDGLMYGQEGAIRRPMTHKGWTMDYLDSLLEELDVRTSDNGEKEVLLAGGYRSITNLNRMLLDKGFVTQDNNVEGRGDEKGVNLNYNWIKIGDVKLYFMRARFFDRQDRPDEYLSDGTSRGSWDSMLVPLGNTEMGDKTVELIQLRPPKKGTVYGINRGGDGMASSVDGESRHFLWQTGIIKRIDIIHSYMPSAN